MYVICSSADVTGGGKDAPFDPSALYNRTARYKSWQVAKTFD
jgi:hypothetical protein